MYATAQRNMMKQILGNVNPKTIFLLFRNSFRIRFFTSEISFSCRIVMVFDHKVHVEFGSLQNSHCENSRDLNF